MSVMSRKYLLGARRSIPGLATLAAGAIWLSAAGLESYLGGCPWPRCQREGLPWGCRALAGFGGLCRFLTQLSLQPHHRLRRCCEMGGVTPPHLHPPTDCTALLSPQAEGSRRRHPRGRRPGHHRPHRRCGTGTGTPSPPSERSWVSGAPGAGLRLLLSWGGLELELVGFGCARPP